MEHLPRQTQQCCTGQHLSRLIVGGFYNQLPLQNNWFGTALMWWTLQEDAKKEWMCRESVGGSLRYPKRNLFLFFGTLYLFSRYKRQNITFNINKHKDKLNKHKKKEEEKQLQGT